LVAPAVLVVVALLQISRVRELDQSSWSGAGFGMFATIDNESFRLVRGWVLDEDGQRPVPLPHELERAAFELQVVPTEERAQGLARRWQEIAAPDTGFVVEVWGISFDSDGPEIHVETKLRVEVP